MNYSHMGIVYVRDDEPFVFETVQPVKATPLHDWITRGEGGHFAVKRLRNADRLLMPEILRRMMAVGESLANLDYDLYFEWSDDRIYCSELVWKVYDRGAGRNRDIAGGDVLRCEPRNRVRELKAMASNSHVKTRSTAEPVLQRLRELCLSLPETSETGSWGHPNFRAGKRTFAAFEWIKDRPSIAFRLIAADVDLLARRRGFFVTPYGRGQWVSVWADRPLDWELVDDLARSSYRLVALKRMITALDKTSESRGSQQH